MEPIKTRIAKDESGSYEAPDCPERQEGAYWILFRLDDGTAKWEASTYRDGKWLFPGTEGGFSRVTVESDYVKRGKVLDIGPLLSDPAPLPVEEPHE